jgi:hypothetical protein
VPTEASTSISAVTPVQASAAGLTANTPPSMSVRAPARTGSK